MHHISHRIDGFDYKVNLVFVSTEGKLEWIGQIVNYNMPNTMVTNRKPRCYDVGDFILFKHMGESLEIVGKISLDKEFGNPRTFE